MSVLLWAGPTALALAIAGSSSCLVDKRSIDFDCETDTDCAAGRVCSAGFCVPGLSSGMLTCDMFDLTCSASCSSSAPCGPLVCPLGFDCTIDCSGPGACGNITCGDGPCDVECVGNNACGFVQCAGSCACDVDCDDGQSCTATPACPATGLDCTDGFGGCDSSEIDCATCS